MKNAQKCLVAGMAIALLYASPVWAQPDLPPTDGGPGCCPDPPDGFDESDPPAAIPFDGGLTWLLGGGIAYGMHRSARQRRWWREDWSTKK